MLYDLWSPRESFKCPWCNVEYGDGTCSDCLEIQRAEGRYEELWGKDNSRPFPVMRKDEDEKLEKDKNKMTPEYEKVVILNDGETFSSATGCKILEIPTTLLKRGFQTESDILDIDDYVKEHFDEGEDVIKERNFTPNEYEKLESLHNLLQEVHGLDQVLEELRISSALDYVKTLREKFMYQHINKDEDEKEDDA